MRAIAEAPVKPLYDSLDSFGQALSGLGNMPAAWVEKMLHTFTIQPSVNREEWLLKRAEGKTVLHIGCTGPFDAALRMVTTRCYGIDHEPQPQRQDFVCLDLDGPEPLPVWEDVELVLVPEILEHLMAPGLLLRKVGRQYPGLEIVITTPNAFCPQPQLKAGIITVNRDHCSWFCPQTLKVLVEKAGLHVKHWSFYGNPAPPLSEGMIFCCD